MRPEASRADAPIAGDESVPITADGNAQNVPEEATERDIAASLQDDAMPPAQDDAVPLEQGEDAMMLAMLEEQDPDLAEAIRLSMIATADDESTETTTAASDVPTANAASATESANTGSVAAEAATSVMESDRNVSDKAPPQEASTRPTLLRDANVTATHLRVPSMVLQSAVSRDDSPPSKSKMDGWIQQLDEALRRQKPAPSHRKDEHPSFNEGAQRLTACNICICFVSIDFRRLILRNLHCSHSRPFVQDKWQFGDKRSPKQALRS